MKNEKILQVINDYNNYVMINEEFLKLKNVDTKSTVDKFYNESVNPVYEKCINGLINVTKCDRKTAEKALNDKNIESLLSV